MEPTNPPTPRLLRSLAHRNYRLYFIGQAASLTGTWVTRVAQQWLVYRLTGSPLWLGTIGFCSQVPTSFLSPIAGVLADRWDKRRMLLATQVLSALSSFALAALALTGVIRVWHVAALALCKGAIDAFEIPVRQSLAIELAGREDLPNAIALNSMLFNATRMAGPALAGALIAAAGEGFCFLLDGFSYLAVIGMLLAVRLAGGEPAAAPQAMLAGLREGFRYSWDNRPIRAVLVLLGVVSLLGLPHIVLMPVFATKVFSGDAKTLGHLVAASGVGALLGTFFLAARSATADTARMMRLSCVTGGLALAGFAWSPSLPLSMGLLAVVGFSVLVIVTSGNTVLQTLVSDNLRGRVMALFGVSVLGTLPYGSLLAGALAEKIGVQWTVFLGGLACILSGVFVARGLETRWHPPAAKPVLPGGVGDEG